MWNPFRRRRSAVDILRETFPEWEIVEFESPEWVGKCYRFTLSEDGSEPIVTHIRVAASPFEMTSTQVASIIMKYFPRSHSDMDITPTTYARRV